MLPRNTRPETDILKYHEYKRIKYIHSCLRYRHNFAKASKDVG
jgi:hypothetical protein